MRRKKCALIAMACVVSSIIVCAERSVRKTEITHLDIEPGTYLYSIRSTTAVPIGKGRMTNIVVSCTYTVQVSHASKEGAFAKVELVGLDVDNLPKPGPGKPADAFVRELAAAKGSSFLIYTNANSLFDFNGEDFKRAEGSVTAAKRHIAAMLRTPVLRVPQERVAWTNMPSSLGVTMPERLQVSRYNGRECVISGDSLRRGMLSRKTQIMIGARSKQLHSIEWRTLCGNARYPPYTVSTEAFRRK